MTSIYSFALSDEILQKLLPFRTKTRFIPPHKENRKWLQKFFDKAGLNFSGWHKGLSDTGVSSRSSCSFEVLSDSNKPGAFKLFVSRNLGNHEWPNDLWKRNTRSPRKKDVRAGVSEVTHEPRDLRLFVRPL